MDELISFIEKEHENGYTRAHSKKKVTKPEVIDDSKITEVYLEMFKKNTKTFKDIKDLLVDTLVEAEEKYDFDHHHNIYKAFMKVVKERGWENLL